MFIHNFSFFFLLLLLRIKIVINFGSFITSLLIVAAFTLCHTNATASIESFLLCFICFSLTYFFRFKHIQCINALSLYKKLVNSLCVYVYTNYRLYLKSQLNTFFFLIRSRDISRMNRWNYSIRHATLWLWLCWWWWMCVCRIIKTDLLCSGKLWRCLLK